MNGSPMVWGTMVVWTGAAAWMDLRRRRVWWAWFILGGLAAGVFRVWEWIEVGLAFDQLLLITAVVAASFQLWRAGVWGGADAKSAMVLILASPDWRMLLVLALVDLALIAGWILAREGWAGLRGFGGRVRGILGGEGTEESETVPLVAIMAFGYWVYLLLFG
jgi:Flp pilus assembly protein protease CpaA